MAATDAVGSGPLTTEEFLRRFPWPAQWAGGERPLDFLWRWDLPASVAKLWPHLSDTSAFNKRLGLPPMQFAEKDGRVFGSAVNAGFRLEWEELPWEWDYGKGLSAVRLYSRGFGRVVRARYLLESLGPELTRLYVYFGWVPRGRPGELLLRLSMPWLKRQYAAALGEIVGALASDRPVALPAEPAPELGPEVRARLEEARSRLLSAGCDAVLVGSVLDFVRTAPAAELHRIRLRPLARGWGARERDLLRTVLHATRAGVFTLSWEVICPHCQGPAAGAGNLGELQGQASCPPCGIDFEATGLNAIEATFRVHPSVRLAERRLYCAAEPARKPHIMVQRRLAAGASEAVETLLAPGRYRLRVAGAKIYNLLDVDGDGGPGSVEWRADDRDRRLAAGPSPTLALANPSSEGRTFVVEQLKADADALRPADLFVLQDFRDLFAEQAVAHDIQLEVGVQTVLFTDLVGSTRFYEVAGDAVAFGQVRRHFVKIFEVVARHEGAIVKTIGDAAMAAFVAPASALAAAVELQRHFNRSNPATELRIRVSLNTGPCLAVNLNSGIDYFGSTVNLAAKLQGVVESQQIVFTGSLRGDPGVVTLLQALPYRIENVVFPLKWSGGKIDVFRFIVD